MTWQNAVFVVAGTGFMFFVEQSRHRIGMWFRERKRQRSGDR